MGAALTIEVDEVSLRRFYARIDPDGLIKDPLDSFYKRFGETIRDKAKHNAPVDTGKMKRSIHLRKDRHGIAVTVETDYAVYVHEGTRPHWPPVNALRGWAERHGISPYAVAASIAKHGTRPQPFLREAMEQSSRALPVELHRMVGDIEKHWTDG